MYGELLPLVNKEHNSGSVDCGASFPITAVMWENICVLQKRWVTQSVMMQSAAGAQLSITTVLSNSYLLVSVLYQKISEA